MPENSTAQQQPATPQGISIRNLTLRAGERTLLEETSAELPAGKVTLIVGPSGAGKSVLLRALAGLLDPGNGASDSPFLATGSIRIGDEEVLAPARRRSAASPTGIVFQNFALFDELSVEANVQFALDHRHAQSRASGIEARALLEELKVPRNVPVSALSGGQKQRLAIARTLAHDPPVVIYDEPTSGLDPANAAAVAGRIRTAGERHGKTTVVVTHDYENLAGIADHVVLLDTGTRKLIELTPGEIGTLPARLQAAAGPAGEEPRPPPSLPARLGALAARLPLAVGGVVEEGALALGSLLPLWPRWRWGLRYFLHSLGLLASFSSALYFGAAGAIAGFVSTHFVFKFLPHKQHTLPLISDDLLTGLGFALYRIITPVLVTILLAARCGAAVTADVGNRVYGHQLEAMRSLGVKPERYLRTGTLLAFLLASPCLVGLGFLCAKWTSLLVYVYNFPLQGPDYWSSHFHRDLKLPGQLLYQGTGWLLLKTLTSGLGVGIVSYQVGRRPKVSGVEVSRGVTRTIIWATLLVLAVHFVFAFLEF